MRPQLANAALHARVGTWLESAVLKVQRKHWVDGATAVAKARAEIFFSVWINDKGIKLNRAFYNVHAFRLRSLTGYALESRKFAFAFRSRFRGPAAAWPNVSVDFGPRTLFEGWVALDKGLEEAVVGLLQRFIPLADIIDQLLDERKVD